MLYLALGDSISIDDYPRQETGHDRLGAASLFHRNDDRFWPEFRGRDLVSVYKSVERIDLTADGATSDDVLMRQMPRVKASEDEAIVTITAGGNDLLMNLRVPKPPPRLVEGIAERIEDIVVDLERKLPKGRILLGRFTIRRTEPTSCMESVSIGRRIGSRRQTTRSAT